MSPRAHRRRSAVSDLGVEATARLGVQVIEHHADGSWSVRTVTGAAARKAYRCPGCDHEIRRGVAHVVVWPADAAGGGTASGGTDGGGAGGWAGADDRRHWHAPCWRARARRRPRAGR